MTLRSKAYARILDLISEGDVGGLVDGDKSIYLNGTPVRSPSGVLNFNGVTYDQRTGTNSQSHIPGIPAVENEVSVSTELTNALPLVRTISNSDVDSVRVRVKVPNLLYQNDNGSTSGETVQFMIEVQANGENYKPFAPTLSWQTSGITYNSSTQATAVDANGILARVSIDGDGSGTLMAQYKSTASGTWINVASVNFESVTTYYQDDWSYWVNRVTTFSGYNGTFFSPNSGEHYIEMAFWYAQGDVNFRIIQTAGDAAPFSIKNVHRSAAEPRLTISGKAIQEYERSYLVPLSGSAPWNIRLTRITPDSTNLRLSNKTFWESYTEVVEGKLRYPNSALVGIKFDSEYFQGIPSRAYDMKLLKVRVPSNYNTVTRTYSGVWDGNFKPQREWTDNPAWCFYDLITNGRYGLGQFITESQVDKWALYSIARYCDELVDDGDGGLEPRFTCNIYLQSRREAYNVIQDMSSVFRGMVYWSSGQITVTQDAPSDPVALFTPANVEEGLFNYQGSASKARHTVALVTWNDPEDMYRQKVEYVEDSAGIARYGVVESQVVAVGCTSRGQANRVGRWLLYSEQAETETVTFKTGIEGSLVRPGQVIKVADPTRSGVRLGGRVHSATTTAVTVDADFTPLLDATLYVQLPDGSVQSRTVASTAGRVINLSSALPSVPQQGATWIMSASTVEAQTFRVITIQEVEDTNIEITALKHEPLKYAAVENGLVLPVRDYTALTLTPAAPSSITLGEALYRYNAEVRCRIDVSWAQANYAKEYRVVYIKDDGNTNSYVTSDIDHEILNITPGNYVVRVYSIGSTGKQSTSYVQGTINVLGKTAPPANVTGFGYVIDPNLGVTLQWNAVADLDLQGYEIRLGSNWATATLVTQRASGTNYKLPTIPAGSNTYLIKALDTSGNYSAGAVSTTLSIAAAAAPTVTSAFYTEQYELTWTSVAGTFATELYEIRQGESFATGTVVARVQGNQFGGRINWFGSRNFYVAAVDKIGIYGLAGAVTVTTIQPENTASLTHVFTDTALTVATITLKWPQAVAYHGLSGYELTYDSVVTVLNSTTITLPADWLGAKTFTVKTIDILGQKSSGTVLTVTKLRPGLPTNPTTSVSQRQLYASWVAPVKTSLPVWGYEVRVDQNMGAANPIYRGTAASCPIPNNLIALGMNTFYVAAIDTDNNYSTGTTALTYTAVVPNNITALTASFEDTSLTAATVTLNWQDISTPFGVDYYQVSYDDKVFKVKATTITLPADWVGNRTFTVKTIDTLGFISTGFQSAQTKLPPAPPANFRAQVIDNNVLFYWDLPERTTLPVSHVLIKRGATWATAETIGTKSGGFTTIQETQAGTFSYWIATIDTDGIESSPVSLTTTVSEPPDFLFFGSFDSTFTGTLSSAIKENGGVVLSVNTTETFEQHFTSRTWADPQAQVTAGYPVFVQPTPAGGYYEETFDFGTIIGGSKTTLDYFGQIIAGTPTLTPTISLSLDNSSWINYAGLTEIYATNFRYVKVRIALTQTSDKAVYFLSSLSVRLDAKQKTDSGMASCLSTDATGTIANFGKEFIDVTSINVTAAGTTPTTAIYDFQDANLNAAYSLVSNVCTVTATAHELKVGQKVRVYFSSGSAPGGVYTVASVPTANTFTVAITAANTSGNALVYPQGFRIYLFNSAGARVSGTASWSIRGY